MTETMLAKMQEIIDRHIMEKAQLRAEVARTDAVLRHIAAWPWSGNTANLEAVRKFARAALADRAVDGEKSDGD